MIMVVQKTITKVIRFFFFVDGKNYQNIASSQNGCNCRNKKENLRLPQSQNQTIVPREILLLINQSLYLVTLIHINEILRVI